PAASATTATAATTTTATTIGHAVAATTASHPPRTAPASTAPATTTPATPDLDAVRMALTKVADLEEPVFVATRAGDATTYIAQRGGRLRALRNGTLVEAPVLDVSGMISTGGERGFLGFAFSPDGSRLYVDYTDTNGDTN